MRAKQRHPHLRLWHQIPAWIRGAGITFAIVVVLLVCNGAFLAVAVATGSTAALVTYLMQLFFYFINGIITGGLADDTWRLKNKYGVYTPRPNHLANGGYAGVLLGVFDAIVLLALRAAAERIIPGILLTGLGDNLWLYMGADLVVAAGLGAIGGFIYRQFLEPPGKK